MDSLDLLRDLTSRPRSAVAALRGALNPVTLNSSPGGHDNSVAWLLWHTGREVDVQLADLTGAEQVWHAQGFAERLGLGDAGEEVGYGHTPLQARRVVVEDGGELVDYVDAALGELEAHLATLSPEALDRVIDDQWDPPVTHGARLVSILDDAIQHLAQAAYALGMPDVA